MTFDEGMNARCSSCGYKAAHHRMTKTRFYCLKLNASGRWKFMGKKEVDIKQLAYRCEVKYLTRSPLGKPVLEAVSNGLTTFASTSAIADTLST